MRKNSVRRLLAAAISVVMISTTSGSTVYAASVADKNNSYYKEVSGMATDLLANVPEEYVRNIGYGSIMANVFGESYLNWEYDLYDLVGIMSREEYENTPVGIRTLAGMTMKVYLTENKDPVYIITKEKIDLNENGINQRNYDDFISLYNTTVYLETTTVNMDDNEKIKVIHDYIADHLTPGDSSTDSQYTATASLADGYGRCQAYATLMYLLGRYCGLDVQILAINVRGLMYHALNTVTIGDTVYYLDVFGDDDTGTYDYYMIDYEQYIAAYDPQPQ